MIPQQTIDQILDRIDLVDLIERYVPLKKSGRSYTGCCPFHQEKTPSFHVFRDKQYYHCFGCQAHGNAVRFLMEFESRSFIDVMQQLSQQTGIELPKNEQDKKRLSYRRTTKKTSNKTSNQTLAQHNPVHENDIVNQPSYHEPLQFGVEPVFHLAQDDEKEGNFYDLLEMVAQFYQYQLQQHHQAQHYFQQRDVNAQSIEQWRLGYAPSGWQHLTEAFPHDVEGLKQLGLIRTSEHGRDFCLLRDRVIFPIRDHKGRVVGFGGRALNDEVKPKYINSPDSDIFHKNQLLYGLYEGTKHKANQWLMVEGYMDVIALHQNGIYGAVATLGTASNSEHLQQLFKRQPRITLAFDGDQAGQKAVRRTLEIALPLLHDGRELQFFVLPSEHDPDSLIRREGVDTFYQLWRKSPLLSDFLFALLSQNQDISTPEGKGAVMAELRQLAELLPKQGSFRYLLQQFFREKLGLAWRKSIKKYQENNDANLSFLNLRTEESSIALLLYYPSLYLRFEDLRAVLPEHELLRQILDIFHYLYENLPEDSSAQMYYMLGACQKYSSAINQLMQSQIFNMGEYNVERLDAIAQDYARLLQRKYLQEKLKQSKTLNETKNLRLQLNVVMGQLAFIEQR